MNRYKTLYLLLFPLFLTGYLRAQNSFYILTGKVVNSHTKLFVNNAHVKIPHADREVITDKNGLFRIAVPTSKTASIIITHSDYNLKLETLNWITAQFTNHRIYWGCYQHSRPYQQKR